MLSKNRRFAMETEDETKMYSIKKLAEMSDLDRRTIWNFIKEGSLKSYKLGHSLRILDEDWKRFLEERVTCK